MLEGLGEKGLRCRLMAYCNYLLKYIYIYIYLFIYTVVDLRELSRQVYVSECEILVSFLLSVDLSMLSYLIF